MKDLLNPMSTRTKGVIWLAIWKMLDQYTTVQALPKDHIHEINPFYNLLAPFISTNLIFSSITVLIIVGAYFRYYKYGFAWEILAVMLPIVTINNAVQMYIFFPWWFSVGLLIIPMLVLIEIQDRIEPDLLLIDGKNIFYLKQEKIESRIYSFIPWT
jgi:hypothetical protein